jgi:hypothetical protein
MSCEWADLRCVMAGVRPRMIHIQMNQNKETEISLSKQNVRELRYLVGRERHKLVDTELGGSTSGFDGFEEIMESYLLRGRCEAQSCMCAATWNGARIIRGRRSFSLSRISRSFSLSRIWLPFAFRHENSSSNWIRSKASPQPRSSDLSRRSKSCMPRCYASTPTLKVKRKLVPLFREMNGS